MHFHILILVLVSMFAAHRAAAQPASKDTAAVVAAVESFHAALAKGDASVVSRLLAEDVVIMEAGNVETRAQYLSSHLPGDIEFTKAVATKRGPIRAIVTGDAAWASSTSEMAGTFQGRAVDLIATELMVFSRVADGWQIRAISWSSRARPKPAQ
jgi:ketosteroid isomerase-like protein